MTNRLEHIDISHKQQPVINRLNDLMLDAIATANAIRDNAEDEQRSIPQALVTSFYKDFVAVIVALHDAADVPTPRQTK